VCDAESAEHAAHIASWHPAVAAEVADWLDAEAAALECEPLEDTGTWRAALSIARAYLGETAPEAGAYPRGEAGSRKSGAPGAEGERR
jgi:hypothetical protein